MKFNYGDHTGAVELNIALGTKDELENNSTIALVSCVTSVRTISSMDNLHVPPLWGYLSNVRCYLMRD